MMRMVFATCALLAAVVTVPVRAADRVGDWMATVSEKHPERLQLTLRFDSSHNSGSNFEKSEFIGLTPAQIASTARVPVEFQLRREAGTLAFEGTFKNGHGAGQFTFTASRDYGAKLRTLGVALSSTKDDEELFSLTIFDVSTDFIRSMQKIGYDEPLEMYVQFRIFKVDPAYVSEMAKVGFGKLTAEKLVETRIHGATPEYIREMRAGGKDLTLDEYIQSRIFQVTPQFAADMAKAGYPNLDHDMLVQFRIHGVTPEVVQQLKEMGYTRVSAEQLVQFQIHGVTPKFVKQLKEVGYSNLPGDQLVQMRIHGVTPEFIRRVEAAGYRKVPVEKLVQMRIFDIEPEMVRALDDRAKAN